jgi:hypothetical protein
MTAFSLPVATHGSADEHESLEQLCRYIADPVLGCLRVHCSVAGKVVPKLKKPWHDASAHFVGSPLESIQRRAAPVSRRRQLAPGPFAGRPRERLLL